MSRPAVLDAFEVLYEAEGLPSYLLPFDLERIYGGIGFPEQVVYSNFVTSVDGVAALEDGASSGSVLSGHAASDRFLMGLLRACADAVLIGAGTLHLSPGHTWTPAQVAPQHSDSFAALRRSLGREPEPRLVVLTATGKVDADHVAIEHGATVITTDAGMRRLTGSLPASCDVQVAGGGEEVDVTRAMDALRRRGFNTVLTEGGPHLMGSLLEAKALDEVFVTISPVIAGRGGDRRLGMVEGAEFLPAAAPWSRLLSARRHGDYLFLRYGVR